MFVQQVVNGLMLGGAYALVAIGYTLIFGVLNLLHLAHGEVFMVGAYVGLANGFVVTFTNGLKVYLSGDAGLSSDMSTVVRDYFGVDPLAFEFS